LEDLSLSAVLTLPVCVSRMPEQGHDELYVSPPLIPHRKGRGEIIPSALFCDVSLVDFSAGRPFLQERLAVRGIGRESQASLSALPAP
jgi:hypothetical protein